MIPRVKGNPHPKRSRSPLISRRSVRWVGDKRSLRIAIPNQARERYPCLRFVRMRFISVGAKVPEDRPSTAWTRVDSSWVISLSPTAIACSRFIGDELVAVRWHEFRLHPKQFMSSDMNMQGLGGYREERNGFSRDLQHRGGPARGSA